MKKYALLFTLFVLLLYWFNIGSMLMMEGYNFVNPYADTQFAENYSPEKFITLKKGMRVNEAVRLMGKPLQIVKYTGASKRIKAHWYYTMDGKLHKNNSWFLLVSDIAWYQSWFEVNNDNIIENIYTGWVYD